jgi:L-threonylcarbamoyladenylate synthase
VLVAVPETLVLPADAAGIAEASRRILAGEPVAVPTETVYGLAADATNAQAVAAIYRAKGRPDFNPLIVHVADLAAAEAIGVLNDAARALAEAHWPGPLTLVVPLRHGSAIAPAVTAGLPTIAIRVPAHPVMQALLRAAERPLAAPSANASGRISPTHAQHVRDSLAGRVGLILDGGPTQAGLESTIVDTGAGQILRPGPITPEQLLHFLSEPLPSSTPEQVRAPGMLASHYAPVKPVRLDATQAVAGEWLIGFGACKGDESLSRSGDLAEAAANLFAALHRADVAPGHAIAVAPIPAKGLGVAINDRLRRSAATRS